jgi:uncharacterized damage-inducible protein DinB
MRKRPRAQTPNAEDSMPEHDWRSLYLADVRANFTGQRSLAERAIAQVSEDELFRTAGSESNSIAVLMKHVGGNLRSRWTEPFETDGEKPDRNRDGEFEAQQDSAEDVRRVWDTGWSVVEDTLSSLEPADLGRTLRIRDDTLTLIAALNRSLAHTAHHVGQIVLLAKQWRNTEWVTLSIPRKGRGVGSS